MKRSLPLLALLLPLGATFANPPPPPPKLALVISIDQFRADYLHRFEPHFVENGFRRLLDRGAVYTEARFRHALTATAPGHAVLLTGAPPSVHGVVANSWFDPASGRQVGAVSDPAVNLIGAAPASSLFPSEGASPRHLLATTVGDQLKLRHGDASRVIALSNKDRAAILLGGHRADAAYWLPTDRFATSTYYRPDLPKWAETFNQQRPVDRLFGHTWDRLLPAEAYDRLQGPDQAPGEESRLGLGATFPRTVDGGLSAPGQLYYEAFRLSPESSTLLAAFATAAIEGEQLGRHPATDLLCLSFSQPDYAGHSYGPDSHEIMDTALRLDRVLAELFTLLDQRLGPEAWIVALSADHGACPLPESAAVPSAGRLDWASLQSTAESALSNAFGPPPPSSAWLARDAYGFRLIPATLQASPQPAASIRRALAAALLQHPQVDSAWTREELLQNAPQSNHPHFSAWRLSYHPTRSPDVVFTPRPYIVDRSPSGTNHGTPHDYDCHVPLVFYGPGIPAGHFHDPVNTEQLAPTLSRLLHIPRPPQSTQPILPHIF